MRAASPMLLAARLAESHPLLWRVAWEAAHLGPLLPHDKSYLAIRHFIAQRPGGLILDIGANDGISALGFRKLDGAAPIVAIEPNPIHSAALARLASKDALFSYRIAACGAAPGTLRLTMPWYGWIPLHTFCSSSEEGALAEVEQAFGRGVAKKVTTTSFASEVITIDELGLAPSIMKIDAEGAGLLVLQGALGTIRAHRPFIVIELGGDRLPAGDLLRSCGYEMATYDASTDRFTLGDAVSGHHSGERNSFAIPTETLPALRPFIGARDDLR